MADWRPEEIDAHAPWSLTSFSGPMSDTCQRETILPPGDGTVIEIFRASLVDKAKSGEIVQLAHGNGLSVDRKCSLSYSLRDCDLAAFYFRSGDM